MGAKPHKRSDGVSPSSATPSEANTSYTAGNLHPVSNTSAPAPGEKCEWGSPVAARLMLRSVRGDWFSR